MNAAPIERSTKDDARHHRLAWAGFPADLATPVRALLALRARGHRATLLESVEGPARLARYSFVGVDPRASLRGTRLRDAEGERDVGPTALDALRACCRINGSARPPPSLPPFCGGWIGFLCYEWACALEPKVARARNDPWGLPDAVFDRYDELVAFDHGAQRVHVLAPCPSGASDHGAAQRRIDEIAGDALSSPPASGAFALDGALEPCVSPAEYLDAARRLRREIGQGEIFQAVLSQRFEQRFRGDPFTLYRVLRIANPSPHMFFFEAGGTTLIGSSPERLVAVRERRAEERPIAGTRPRGATAADDDALAAELRGDPKEHAEHDMLVDLARNDLGRVAAIGSVRVREHAVLERFARVMHLVSRVECELASDREPLDALAAAFPAGTVSGAPKVRAMQLIAEAERETRGPYAGAFGYVDFQGNLDMALVLRSFVARGSTLSVQAGAGIVFDSDPEREHQETLDKARALFDAARLAESAAFQPGSEP
jgi:anthranilate synthase component 1